MEGQERRHLEARIRVLRDIQTLLDAAVLQMNQYGLLVARLEHESVTTANSEAGRTGPNEEPQVPPPTPAAEPPIEDAVSSPPASVTRADDEDHEVLTAEEETNLSDQERLRRRRLQRFMNGVEQN